MPGGNGAFEVLRAGLERLGCPLEPGSFGLAAHLGCRREGKQPSSLAAAFPRREGEAEGLGASEGGCRGGGSGSSAAWSVFGGLKEGREGEQAEERRGCALWAGFLADV